MAWGRRRPRARSSRGRAGRGVEEGDALKASWRGGRLRTDGKHHRVGVRPRMLLYGSSRESLIYDAHTGQRALDVPGGVPEARVPHLVVNQGPDRGYGATLLLICSVFINFWKRILLLDEVTGALDVEAEKSSQEALDIFMLGTSSIIIARRLCLISNADYIAVMEEGGLVEMGTHEELLNLDGFYAERTSEG